MTRFFSVAVLGGALALTAACDGRTVCRKAVEDYYETGHTLQVDGEQLSDVEAAVDYCESTQYQANQSGCQAEHVWLRQCLEAADELPPGGAAETCNHDVSALEACLNGVRFEQDCGNGVDDDEDGSLDCFDADCRENPICPGSLYFGVPVNPSKALDLLFVVDNSGTMGDEQFLLWRNFEELVRVLRTWPMGLPDLHVGVTSTDLGAGGHSITYCEDEDGDDGRLLTGSCANPQGSSYIVDVRPQGCEIQWDVSTGQCPSHDCVEGHCAHEPSTTLVIDGQGCPRCQNYLERPLEEVFSCTASLGTMGCGFEQPLEAMARALTSNPGFLREHAFLGVVIISDEDDCSAEDPQQLFDPTIDDIDSTLGPLTSYRCFEFGVTCDINSRTHEGRRQNCVPREDTAALLTPVSYYADLLRELKIPQLLLVSAVAGPVVRSENGVGFDVHVEEDEYGYPAVLPGCSNGNWNEALPAVRLMSFVQEFNEDEDLAWAYSSICSDNYDLLGVGWVHPNYWEHWCLPAPPVGCTDVAAEYGLAGDGQSCNDHCQPECTVSEIRQRDLPNETTVWIPTCLEVCSDGPCPGNTDRTVAYAQGHPPAFDVNLPVEVCWHLTYEEECPHSNFAELALARRSQAPPRTYATMLCSFASFDEELCNDGVDNDGDCLVDLDDPCCANPDACRLLQ